MCDVEPQFLEVDVGFGHFSGVLIGSKIPHQGSVPVLDTVFGDIWLCKVAREM